MNGRTRQVRVSVVSATLLLWLFISGVSSYVGAQQDRQELRIEVVPGEVILKPGSESEIHVTARNITTRTIQDITLVHFTDTDIQVEGTSESDANLAPQDLKSWILKISQVGNDRISGTVHLRIDYSWQPETNVAMVTGAAYQASIVGSATWPP